MNEELNFKLEVFDGPLDLLLTLITKQKIQIFDIPIAKILDQFMDYLEYMNEINADISSEFIVMACELLYIKSKMLLPKEEEDDDPRAELVISLIEYSRIKVASEFLSARGEHFFNRYYPTPKPFVVKIETQEYDKEVLLSALLGLHVSLKSEREKKKKEDVQKIFSTHVVPIEVKVIYILRRLVKSLNFGNAVSFNAIFSESDGRSDSVATFLAMLELVSSGRINFMKNDNDYIISLNKTKEA